MRITRRQPERARILPSHWFDLLAVSGLAVTAFVLRRDGLPHDGLFFDDSWVAAGAVKGSLANLWIVGSAHPGFTAALMASTSIAGSDFRALAYPALIAGTIGSPLLHLALRRFGYARSICVLMGAALVVARVHILYSGRVKGYTLDPLLVLGLVVLIPRLARMSWRWQTAIAWLVGLTVSATFSGFALVASAAAGVVLLLHPASDRTIRAGAISARAAVFLAHVTLTQRAPCPRADTFSVRQIAGRRAVWSA